MYIYIYLNTFVHEYTKNIWKQKHILIYPTQVVSDDDADEKMTVQDKPLHSDEGHT